MKKRRNPSFWLYVIGIYILLQFFWWAWLLIDQSSEIVELVNPDDPHTVLQRRVWMVLGEGLVFVILLIFGFRKLNQSIQKEVHTAHTQRNFLLSFTHELNTPLATIQLYLETLLKRDLNKEQQRSIIERTESETARLKALVDNILTSARIEEKQMVLHPAINDINEEVEQVVASFEAKVDAGRLTLQTVPNVKAKFDPLAIHSIVSNLIDNAIKYDPNNNPIEVKTSTNGDWALVEVHDQGIGIDMDDRSSVFSKFYRVQSENTRSTKGTGLGLFIAKNLAEMLGGDITYSKNNSGGSSFTLKIPVK